MGSRKEEHIKEQRVKSRIYVCEVYGNHSEKSCSMNDARHVRQAAHRVVAVVRHIFAHVAEGSLRTEVVRAAEVVGRCSMCPPCNELHDQVGAASYHANSDHAIFRYPSGCCPGTRNCAQMMLLSTFIIARQPFATFLCLSSVQRVSNCQVLQHCC